MTENTLYHSHHALAQNLVETIFSAILQTFDDRDAVTVAELSEAFERIRYYWPKVLPVFETTCRECSALNQKSYVPDRRRRDFLTRLVFSRIVDQVPRRPLLRTDHPFPHLLAPGLQAVIRSVLSGNETEIFNQLARSIFDQVGTDRDDEVWSVIARSDPLVMLANRILIRLLLSFKNFNTRRWEVFRVMQGTLDDSVYKFDEIAFCEIFDALFGDFQEQVKSEEMRLRFNLFHGDDTAEQINAVLLTYQRYRQSLAAPSSGRRAAGSRR